MAKPKLKNEIETLREDASKIVSDISSLSKTMGSASKEKSQQIAESISKQAEEELKILRTRMRELEERSKKYAKVVDQHVKQNPYLYILGFLGMGVLLGKLLAPKSR